MNKSSMYLSHIDGFSDIEPNAISSKKAEGHISRNV